MTYRYKTQCFVTQQGGLLRFCYGWCYELCNLADESSIWSDCPHLNIWQWFWTWLFSTLWWEAKQIRLQAFGFIVGCSYGLKCAPQCHIHSKVLFNGQGHILIFMLNIKQRKTYNDNTLCTASANNPVHFNYDRNLRNNVMGQCSAQ